MEDIKAVLDEHGLDWGVGTAKSHYRSLVDPGERVKRIGPFRATCDCCGCCSEFGAYIVVTEN